MRKLITAVIKNTFSGSMTKIDWPNESSMVISHSFARFAPHSNEYKIMKNEQVRMLNATTRREENGGKMRKLVSKKSYIPRRCKQSSAEEFVFCLRRRAEQQYVEHLHSNVSHDFSLARRI